MVSVVQYCASRTTIIVCQFQAAGKKSQKKLIHFVFLLHCSSVISLMLYLDETCCTQPKVERNLLMPLLFAYRNTLYKNLNMEIYFYQELKLCVIHFSLFG